MMATGGFRDLLDETAAGVTARPARLALTVLGTVLGVATLVATLGIAQTAGGQISEQFDLVTATEVIVSPRAFDDGAPTTGAPTASRCSVHAPLSA